MVIWNKTNESYYVSYIDVMKMQRNVLEYNMEGSGLKLQQIKAKRDKSKYCKYVKDNSPGEIYSLCKCFS